MWLMQNAMAKPDNAGAASTDYMHLFGLVSLGYMWALMAKAANEKRAPVPMARRVPGHQAAGRQVLHGADHAGNGCARLASKPVPTP
jgi:hypothetical protein